MCEFENTKSNICEDVTVCEFSISNTKSNRCEYVKEPKRCEFVNTKGNVCGDVAVAGTKCCERHQCTFIRAEGDRCCDVTSCFTQWYCRKHGILCVCAYREKTGKKCGKSIYYYSYMTGCYYCSDHCCSIQGCVNIVASNDKHLCEYHYNKIHFCQFVDHYGEKCENEVDEEIVAEMQTISRKSSPVPSPIPTQADAFDMMISSLILEHIDLHEKNKHPEKSDKPKLYCSQHRCAIKGCMEVIRNENVRYCFCHSKRCEQSDLNGQCERFCRIDRKYCDFHICKWTDICDDHQCENPVKVMPDCMLYCEKHYEKVKFYEDEYSNK